MSVERKSEYVVPGTPEVCLGLLHQFFASKEWPDYDKSGAEPFGRGGPSSNLGIGHLNNSAGFALHRWFGRGPLSCATIVVLTLVTFGLFGFLWVMYMLLGGSDSGPFIAVSAEPLNQDQTRLVATWNKPEYAEALGAWVQSELIDKAAATR